MTDGIGVGLQSDGAGNWNLATLSGTTVTVGASSGLLTARLPALRLRRTSQERIGIISMMLLEPNRQRQLGNSSPRYQRVTPDGMLTVTARPMRLKISPFALNLLWDGRMLR
jgi:hypothetical protein